MDAGDIICPMKPLYTSEGMSELDHHTIEVMGVPAEHLMNNAALRIFDVLTERFPSRPPVLIIAGPGNNGGDGIALATYLHRAGWLVTVKLLAKVDEPKYPTSVFLTMAENLGVKLDSHIPRACPPDIWRMEWGVVVDALFGTGLDREIKKAYLDVISEINKYREGNDCAVVAIDAPSGISSTTGQVFGGAVKADLTVTIEHDKLGFHNFASADLTGEVVVEGIGFSYPQREHAVGWTVESEDVLSLLCQREKRSHKGTYGKVLMVGGGRGMTGAAQLAARAVLRVGAGIVRLVVPEKLQPELSAIELEVMVEGAPDTDSGAFSRLALPTILGFSQWADVLAIGCGIGRDKQTLALVKDIIAKSEIPVIIDADGILALKSAGNPPAKSALGITPHPGEFSSVSKILPETLKMDPFSAVKEFATSKQCSVALKSGENFTADTKGGIFHSPTGNPGMATAGSGDVLTGVIAGILAPMAVGKGAFSEEMHDALASSLWAGQYVHGLAGDIAVEIKGLDGLIAGDILECLPKAMARIREGETR